MARAFGYRFFDAAGQDLPDGGAALARLARIEGQTDPRLVRPAIDVACDVRNPLLGPEGATAVYGPQKGATPAIQRELEAALTRYADVVEAFVGRDVRSVPGAGAAGGLGAGLIAFLDARLVSGSALVLDAVGFDKKLVGADLVVTGEGRIDGQSVYGKLTHAVTIAAKRRGVPVVAVAGILGPGHETMRDAGVEAIETLAGDAEADRDTAMRDPLPRIEDAAERLARARAVARGSR